jgi:HTH-type transcriptional regulator/antitoxin HigA
VLRAKLDERRWTQDELAAVIGYSRQAISQIVSGKVGVSPEMAAALGSAFGESPAEWLRLDAEHQLALVERRLDGAAIERRARIYGSAPIREMQKRGWIKETSSLEHLEQELTAFFGGPIDGDISFPVATLRTVALSTLNAAERAWCFRARQLANVPPIAQFDRSRMPALEKRLRLLAAYPEEVRRLPRVLSEHGIRFVVVEPLTGVKIDGATFWIGDTPVIAVSVRWDRVDSFWFTVMHEITHIKNGDAYSFDANLLREDDDHGIVVVLSDDDAEKRASEGAAEALVPQAELDSFVRRLSPIYPSVRIIQFANKVKMHPGIIVGQLQHRGELGYSSHRDFLVKVRALITETAVTDGWGQSLSPGTVLGGIP